MSRNVNDIARLNLLADARFDLGLGVNEGAPSLQVAFRHSPVSVCGRVQPRWPLNPDAAKP